MPPAKKSVEWTNVVGGLVLAAIGAIGGRFMLASDGVTALQARSAVMPERRDRELDDVKADLRELRAFVIERCK